MLWGTLVCWLVVSVTPVAGNADGGPESPR
jgi:hypothetical protein